MFAPGSDTGGQMRIDWDMGEGWRQQLYMLHLGRNLQLNDFGYLERNNFNYARYDLAKRFTAFPETSQYSATDWHGAVSRRMNDQGLHIADAAAVNRSGQLRDGGNDFFEIATWTSGHDDLITRGNGVVDMPAKYFLFYERNRPRQGDGHWSFYGNVRLASEGLDTPDKVATSSTSNRPTTSTTASASSPPGTSSTTPTGCCGAAATCWAASTRT